MLFADFSASTTKSDRIPYINMTFGTHKFQFVKFSDKYVAEPVNIHYIPSQRLVVACLGDGCYICERNREVLKTSNDPKSDPAYIKRDVKFFSYIKNLTPSRKCPYCGAENPSLAKIPVDVCQSCQSVISNVEIRPLDQIQVLAVYKGLASEIAGAIEAVFGQNIEKIFEHPVVLTVKPMAGNTKRRVYHFEVLKDEHVDPIVNYDLPPLRESVINLSYEEQKMALDGMLLKDIYAIRKSNNSTPTNVLDERINELFGGAEQLELGL